MGDGPNRSIVEMSGRWDYQLASLARMCWISIRVYLRRMDKGPLRPGWNWTIETGTEFLKTQLRVSSAMSDIRASREYEDSLVTIDPALKRIKLQPGAGVVRGTWFIPPGADRDRFVLYLHGGGYAFYARAHHSMIAVLAEATGISTFALDYRLAPEHPFPAQLQDAVAAYRWLVGGGVAPSQLIIMGDSAGGNLALALLLALRDSALPQPSLAICLSPWTDLGFSGESMTRNERFDIFDRQMVEKWTAWFLHGADRKNPLVSPAHAQLNDLAPIYVQAGGSEVLCDMICEFAERARQQKADIALDVWPNMNHDFQAFGQALPESREALESIREMIKKRVR